MDTYPMRFVGSRRTAWQISLLFLAIGVGSVFLGIMQRDEPALIVGAIVTGISGAWVLYLILRRPPVLVLHADALEWRGQRFPYSAVKLGPLQSSTYDDFDSHSFQLVFNTKDAPATIHSELWPRWNDIRSRIAERIAACK